MQFKPGSPRGAASASSFTEVCASTLLHRCTCNACNRATRNPEWTGCWRSRFARASLAGPRNFALARSSSGPGLGDAAALRRSR